MQIHIHPDAMLTSFATPISRGLRRAVTVSLGFSLLPDNPGAVVATPSCWAALAMALPEGVCVDMGLPKPAAEWLMAGSACAPRGTQTDALPVEVSVGRSSRRFHVMGARTDAGAGPTPPQPFERMPLDWDRTADPRGPRLTSAGETLPCVTDATDDALLGGASRAGLATPPACPAAIPALLRPYLMPSANGMPFSGTYDDAWLLSRWPAPPDDFDWSVLNLAQPAQRLDTPFSGLEGVRVTNMHPDFALLEARLPGLRVRIFAEYADGKTDEKNATGTGEDAGIWREAKVAADTVWLMPNSGVGLQLWHATLPTENERSSDIERIVVVFENASEASRPADILIAQALAPAEPEAGDAEPEPAPEPEEEAKNEEKEEAEELPAPVKTAAMAAPAAPTVPVPTAPEPMNPLDEFLKALDSDMEQDMKEVVDQANDVLRKMNLSPTSMEDCRKAMEKQVEAIRKLANTPVPTPEQAFAKAGFTPKQMEDIMEAANMTPPSPQSFPSDALYQKALDAWGAKFAKLTNADAGVTNNLLSQIRSMDALAAAEETVPSTQALSETLAKAGLAANPKMLDAALEQMATGSSSDSAILASMDQLGRAMGIPGDQMAAAYLTSVGNTRKCLYSLPEVSSAIEQAQVALPSQAPALNRLKALIAQPPQGEPFDLASLARKAGVTDAATLAEFKALDAMPMDVDVQPEPQKPAPEKAPQEAPPLPKAPEEKPSETQTLENEAPEEPLALNQMDLRGANLAGLALVGADLAGCDLSDANLAGSDLSGADLSHAKLSGACLKEATLTGANLDGATLTGADCTRMLAEDASLEGTVLSGGILAGSSFRGATLRSMNLSDMNLAGLDLAGATLSDLSLAGALLENATLDGTTFENCRLAAANLTRASLAGARIYHSDLAGVRLVDANLSDSSWLKTTGDRPDLRNATLTGATFEECVHPGAQLTCISGRGARFLSCKLSGASLANADLMEGALRDCNLADANLDGASLYGADLFHMSVSGRTSLSGTDYTNTCLAHSGMGDIR